MSEIEIGKRKERKEERKKRERREGKKRAGGSLFTTKVCSNGHESWFMVHASIYVKEKMITNY